MINKEKMFLFIFIFFYGSGSFHRTYNGQFYHPRPHIYLVIKVLIEFQLEAETKIRAIAFALYNDQKMLNARNLP